ncbi:FliM/FliN family flagellar motor switch protein [Buchnera aphidicola]|uniref:FliM/FliN family flagellar motor switch protein n=1 Tax=Buchnera aphidicola TaxID=9 RepID=UPI0031B70656
MYIKKLKFMKFYWLNNQKNLKYSFKKKEEIKIKIFKNFSIIKKKIDLYFFEKNFFLEEKIFKICSQLEKIFKKEFDLTCKVNYKIQNYFQNSTMKISHDLCFLEKLYFLKDFNSILGLLISQNMINFFLNIFLNQKKNNILIKFKNKYSKIELTIFKILTKFLYKIFYKNFLLIFQEIRFYDISNLFMKKKNIKENENFNLIIKFYITSQYGSGIFFNIYSTNIIKNFLFKKKKKILFQKKKIYFATLYSSMLMLQKIPFILRVFSQNYFIFLSEFLKWKCNYIFFIKEIKIVTAYIERFSIFLAKYGLYNKEYSLQILKILKIQKKNLFFQESDMNIDEQNNKKILEKSLKNFTLEKNNSNFQDSILKNQKKDSSYKISKEKTILSKNFKNLKIISHLPMNITVELGYKKITIKKLLTLTNGSIISLKKKEGDALNIFANGYLIAQGELVMVKKKYGIRIISMISDPI